MVDWSAGEYERTAAELEPAARQVVASAAIAPGERVLDIACGTGNAALIAAEAGATVVGLDSAARLVDVAPRARGGGGR
jgi:2-polyprenyl-3-methyl-5-hydroxy-6-metoxy-1,4-benzoquinol methylase